ncbi:hypothetical protein ACFYQA_31135 [Streptomyces sp. NPDC005774]|uniref:hypothetical protein n=1 Tax=Streptomyces sp. NPDC005774 TaxID=3364728 RepID=UPI0036A0352D
MRARLMASASGSYEESPSAAAVDRSKAPAKRYIAGSPALPFVENFDSSTPAGASHAPRASSPALPPAPDGPPVSAQAAPTPLPPASRPTRRAATSGPRLRADAILATGSLDRLRAALGEKPS